MLTYKPTLKTILAVFLMIILTASAALAQNSSFIDGFHAADDGTRKSDGVIAADDNVTIGIDYSDDGEGVFSIVNAFDWDGDNITGGETLISVDGSGIDIYKTLNMHEEGIEEAGAISGATTITASDAIEGGSFTTDGNLTVGGEATLDSLSVTQTLDVLEAARVEGNFTAEGAENTIVGSTSSILGVTDGGMVTTSADGASVLSDSGKGLTISGDTTTLSGGSDSTEWTLNDQATLTVGGVEAFSASEDAGEVATVIGGTSGSENTIGHAGTSTNIITGETGEFIGTERAQVTGDNAELLLVEDSATLGVDGGSLVTATDDSVSALTQAGYGMDVNNDGTIILQGTDSAGLSVNAAGTEVSLLNNVSGGHGLEITENSTILTGGTNSSSLELEDSTATLSVGTETTPEIQVLQATNIDEETSVVIGGDDNISNQLLATGADGVNLIEATTSNTLTAGTDNVLNASEQNLITGGEGNIITATTGDNEMIASGGSNIFTADTSHQIEAPLTEIGVNTANSINTIGNDETSVNTLQGATNTIQSGLENVLTVDSTTTEVVGTAGIYAEGTAGDGSGNRMIVDTTSSRFVSEDGNTSAVVNNDAATITGSAGHQMIADSDNARFVSENAFSSAAVSNESVVLTANDDLTDNNRSRLDMAPTQATLFVNHDTGSSVGLDVNQERTILSGGTGTTTLTLDDSGATFRDETTGGPARVTGVADGRNDYDAANMRQVRKAYSGIASVAALAAIPAPAPDKNYSIGVGVGHYENENAMAFGVNAKLGSQRRLIVSAGVGLTEDRPVINGGLNWSF